MRDGKAHFTQVTAKCLINTRHYCVDRQEIHARRTETLNKGDFHNKKRSPVARAPPVFTRLSERAADHALGAIDDEGQTLFSADCDHVLLEVGGVFHRNLHIGIFAIEDLAALRCHHQE